MIWVNRNDLDHKREGDKTQGKGGQKSYDEVSATILEMIL